MFFTKSGAVVAWLLFVSSAIHIGFAFFFLTQNDPHALALYFFNDGTTGEMIDEATRGIGIAIVIGILVEISKSLRKDDMDSEKTSSHS